MTSAPAFFRYGHRTVCSRRNPAHAEERYEWQPLRHSSGITSSESRKHPGSISGSPYRLSTRRCSPRPRTRRSLRLPRDLASGLLPIRLFFRPMQHSRRKTRRHPATSQDRSFARPHRQSQCEPNPCCPQRPSQQLDLLPETLQHLQRDRAQ